MNVPNAGSASHLYTLDLGAAHASAAIHQKQQLSGGFVKFCRFAQQAGTEVQHQDGAAQNVFVVSLPHKLQLWETDGNSSVYRLRERGACLRHRAKEAPVSTNLPIRLRIFSSAADEIPARGDLFFILAEGEPASL